MQLEEIFGWSKFSNKDPADIFGPCPTVPKTSTGSMSDYTKKDSGNLTR